jgi:hypothetical protein
MARGLFLLFGIALIGIAFLAGRQFPSNEVILDHLRTTPELLVENQEIVQVAREWAANKREREEKRARIEILRSHSEFLTEVSPVLVSTLAGVKLDIIEFVDYQCVPCRHSFPVLLRAQEADPEIRIIYQFLPQMGAASELAARMALAAHLQGKFKEFHHGVMQMNAAIGQDSLIAIATRIGLNTDRLNADIHSEKVRAHLKNTHALAEKLGVIGLPSFILGGELIAGGLTDEGLRVALEKARSHPFAL